MSEALGIGVAPSGLATARPRAVPLAGSAKLTNLQVLRALAAGLVALLHASGAVEHLRGDGRFLQVFDRPVGVFGVALFFAMSGYLMAQLIRTSDASSFLLHRVTRIYPVFLAVALAALALKPLFGVETLPDLLAFTLAPAGTRGFPLGVEWTLVYEVTFYVMLFLAAAAGWARRVELIAAGWLAILAALKVSGLQVHADSSFLILQHLLLGDANVAFALGLLLPGAIRRGLLPATLCMAAVPASLVVIVTGDFQHTRWGLSVPAILMVAAAVQLPQFRTTSRLARTAVRAGDWSYALYLVHMPIAFIVSTAAPAGFPTPALFAASLALAAGATVLVGPLDVGVYRRLRRVVDGLSARRRTLLAWGFALLYLGTAAALGTLFELDQAREARIRAAVASLPTGSLADDAALTRGIDAAGVRAADGLAGEIGRAARLPSGQVLVTGWAAELARPASPVHLALACNGRVVRIARQQRYRPDVAAKTGQSGLRTHRIGYTAVLEKADCPAGAAILPILVGETGRLCELPSIPADRVEAAAARSAL